MMNFLHKVLYLRNKMQACKNWNNSIREFNGWNGTLKQGIFDGKVSVKKIRSAIFERIKETTQASWFSLGGLLVFHFQKCMDVLMRLFSVVDEFYNKGVVNAVTNATFTCLIPKRLDSMKISHYTVLSLVTSI